MTEESAGVNRELRRMSWLSPLGCVVPAKCEPGRNAFLQCPQSCHRRGSGDVLGLDERLRFGGVSRPDFEDLPGQTDFVAVGSRSVAQRGGDPLGAGGEPASGTRLFPTRLPGVEPAGIRLESNARGGQP